jgi:hypothetical protein
MMDSLQKRPTDPPWWGSVPATVAASREYGESCECCGDQSWDFVRVHRRDGRRLITDRMSYYQFCVWLLNQIMKDASVKENYDLWCWNCYFTIIV